MSASKQALVAQQEQPLTTQSELSQPLKLIEQAIQNNAGKDTLDRLFELQERWEKNQAKKQFDGAFAAFQEELPTVIKSKKASFETRNGLMEYSYASIDDVVKALKPVLPKFGFSYRFEQVTANNVIKVICILTHKEGHSVSCSMQGFADQSGNKNPMQQQASSFSYLKKYTLSAVTGLAAVDEDVDGQYETSANQPYIDQQPQATPQPDYYPTEDFEKNFPKWKEAIQSGQRTKEQVITMVSSKAPLTEEQQKKIKAVRKQRKSQ